MKVLSLWEPWATLMAIGAKRIETRSWSTSYRGWLAIHASKGGLSKRDLADTLSIEPFASVLRERPLQFGKIVAVVDLIDCIITEDFTVPAETVFDKYPELLTKEELSFGDYEPHRYGWVTRNLFRLPDPIPLKGKQGLFDAPEEIVVEMRRQWKERAT